MKFSNQKSPEDIALEKQLRAMQPAALSKVALDSLEQRLESTVSPDLPAAGDKHSDISPKADKSIQWRPVLWSVAAILMVGLWLASVYLPGQAPGIQTQTKHGASAEDKTIPIQHNPDREVDSSLPEKNLEYAAGVHGDLGLGEAVTRNLRLTGVRDDGIVMSIGNTPMKRLRYEFIDTYHWTALNGGGQMRMEVPRADFVLVPVSTY